MARLKISEAAKLVGLDRKTLYKHIKQGKLSAGIDSLGAKYVDTAELHRVYGNFSAPDDTGDKTETATLETVVEELRQLRKAHVSVLEELRQLRKQVAAGQPFLEHKPEPNTGSKFDDKEKQPQNPPTELKSHYDDKQDRAKTHSFSTIIQRMKENLES